jgi:hypothetical protein
MTQPIQFRCYSRWFTVHCRFQPSQKCAQTLQLCPSTPSLLSMAGFPGVFAMTIGARFLRSRSPPSNLFEPFLHTPELQFLIQNT